MTEPGFEAGEVSLPYFSWYLSRSSFLKTRFFGASEPVDDWSKGDITGRSTETSKYEENKQTLKIDSHKSPWLVKRTIFKRQHGHWHLIVHVYDRTRIILNLYASSDIAGCVGKTLSSNYRTPDIDVIATSTREIESSSGI